MSVYGSVLSASDVAAHYAASTVTNAAPTADFGSSCTGATCAFSHGQLDHRQYRRLYAWDFGDGGTGTGATPTHCTRVAPGPSTSR